MINNVELANASSACEFLRNCIRQLKKNAGNVTAANIARKLKIPTSTLNRIENMEVETPDFNNAMKIVRAVCKDEAVNKFVEKFYSKMAQTFARVYSGNSEVPFVEPDIEAYFEDSNTYEYLMLATSNVKMTEESILENYGKRGLAKVNELIEREILKKQGDTILLSRGPVNAGQETVHKLLQNLITFNYDVGAFGRKDNWLTIQYEAANKSYVMPRVVDIMRSANQQVRELLESPSSKGNDVVWVGMSADTIDKLDPSLEDNKGVIQ